MSSQLNGKTNEYSIDTGISFDYSYAIPPTQTGTVTDTNSANWTLSGVAPVYESTEGPLGGGGSWNFDTTGGNNCRIRSTSTTLRALFTDRNYAVGFWVKTDNKFADPYDGFPIQTVAPFNATNTTSCGYTVSIITEGDGTKHFEFFNGSETVIPSIVVNPGEWYFISIWKYNATWKFYINGSFVGQPTNYNANAAATSINWGLQYQGYDSSFNLCNWFVQPTSLTGGGWTFTQFEAQIADIYNAGVTRNIKYWDGSAWVNSNGNKVWNGSAWVDIDTKSYWNGSSWVAI